MQLISPENATESGKVILIKATYNMLLPNPTP